MGTFLANTIFIHNNNETPLLLAGIDGNIDMIKCLMQHNCDLESMLNHTETKHGHSLFLRLCYYGHFQCIEYLVSICDELEMSNKMNILATDYDNNNGLHLPFKIY